MVAFNTPLVALAQCHDEQVRSLESAFHWVIDMGHGGLTRGKRSPVLPDGRQLLEWEFNADIGRHVSERLTALNIDHTLIPPDQANRGNDLAFRYTFANNLRVGKPKIFVSIHGNAGPAKKWSRKFRGIECWHYYDSKTSQRLAQIFQLHLIRATGAFDRGTKYKTERQFSVLANTTMPAVLTENLFFNNDQEVKLMLDPAWRKKCAGGHVDAIKYIELNGIIL